MTASNPDYMTETDRKAFALVLEIWREFMRGGDHSQGYHHRDSIMQSDGALDFDQLCDQADYAIYQAADACIDSLEPSHKVAIYVTNGQAKAVRFGRLDPVKTLMDAEIDLLARLKKNICTGVKF
jgi:hypothetical protein